MNMTAESRKIDKLKDMLAEMEQALSDEIEKQSQSRRVEHTALL